MSLWESKIKIYGRVWRVRGKGEMIKLYYKPKSKWENGGNEIIF